MFETTNTKLLSHIQAAKMKHEMILLMHRIVLTYRTDLMKPRNTSKYAQAWNLSVEASACIIGETL